MTLSELLTQVATRNQWPKFRTDNTKTALRHLAAALGKPSPDACAPDALPTDWHAQLTDHLTQKGRSRAAIRNAKNYLRYLLKQGKDQQLLRLPDDFSYRPPRRKEAEQANYRSSPYREHFHRLALRYSLRYPDWPPAIRHAWETYRDSGHHSARPVTLQGRQVFLARYLGYYHHIRKKPLKTWHALFTLAHLEAFVRWHSHRAGVPITMNAYRVAEVLTTIARQCNHPHAAAIGAYYHNLPKPPRLHNKKRYHWATPAQIEWVALNELAQARRPFRPGGPGAGRLHALQHQRALMIRWLKRLPLRQRNLRKARLDRNVYQDPDGHWHIHFEGHELKVATRRGHTNVYHVDLTQYFPDLAAHLEEFLTVYRKRLPHHDTNDHLFLSSAGKPYSGPSLQKELTVCFFKYLGKHLYPHVLRTIWVSEFLTKGGTLKTAAYMLNDTVHTVTAIYDELMEDAHLLEASAFNRTTNGNGLLSGPSVPR